MLKRHQSFKVNLYHWFNKLSTGKKVEDTKAALSVKYLFPFWLSAELTFFNFILPNSEVPELHPHSQMIQNSQPGGHARLFFFFNGSTMKGQHELGSGQK